MGLKQSTDPLHGDEVNIWRALHDYSPMCQPFKALFVLFSTNDSLGEDLFCYGKKIEGLGMSWDKLFSLMIDDRLIMIEKID